MQRVRVGNLLGYFFVILWSAMILAPLSLMVIGSFKKKTELFTEPLGLPHHPDFANYATAWNTGMGTFLLNSLLVSILTVIVVVSLSGAAAYAISSSKHPAARIAYLVIVAAFAVPGQAVLVPLFQIISAAGMLNSQLAIVLPYAAFGIPFTTILLYAFFVDFPRELEEAAVLDGCGKFTTLFRVVLPLSGPAIASASIFQFVFVWNEFVIALLSLTRPSAKTLPVGITYLQGQFTSNWPAILAGLTIAVVPALLVYAIGQKNVVRSLAGLGK